MQRILSQLGSTLLLYWYPPRRAFSQSIVLVSVLVVHLCLLDHVGYNEYLPSISRPQSSTVSTAWLTRFREDLLSPLVHLLSQPPLPFHLEISCATLRLFSSFHVTFAMALQTPPPEIMMSWKVYHAFNYYQYFVICSVFPHVPKFILFFFSFLEEFWQGLLLCSARSGLGRADKAFRSCCRNKLIMIFR